MADKRIEDTVIRMAKEGKKAGPTSCRKCHLK